MSELIYHYTDAAALESIVSKEEVWLSSHHYMNDEKEIADGFEIITKELNNLEDIKAYTKDEMALSLFPWYAATKSTFFSMSFSKEKDLLSQWRSYCPKDGGFAIGFNKDLLEKNIINRDIKIVECLYDEKLKKEESKKYAKLFFKKDVHIDFPKIMAFVASCKHNSFNEEQEVRMFTYSNEIGFNHKDKPLVSKKQTSYRTKSNLFIPYIKQKIFKSCIYEIVIGPSKNAELVKNSLKQFLSDHGMPNFNVVTSSIPYRVL